MGQRKRHNECGSIRRGQLGGRRVPFFLLVPHARRNSWQKCWPRNFPTLRSREPNARGVAHQEVQLKQNFMAPV